MTIRIAALEASACSKYLSPFTKEICCDVACSKLDKPETFVSGCLLLTILLSEFTNAFEEINKNFEYMCKEILNGARGEIKINDYENLLETGLELSVKYKNKPEQTLMLLSGGEKSMLAVSFIMAIFMFKPSPFTFFDEIEAALDETNTKKIVGLLNGLISKSQFILITHNKETMKGSHRLYGVTMNKEIGESRIVSVDV